MRPLLALLVLAGLTACASQAPSARESVPAKPTRAWLVVLDKADAKARILDAHDGTLHALAPTGNGPHEVAITPDGRTAVVADYGAQTPGRTLTLVDLASGAVTRTIELAPHTRPHGIEFASDGTLLVTSETSRAVLEIDLDGGKVARVLPTDAELSHMLALSPDGTRVYTANMGSGSVSAIDRASGKVVAQTATGTKPEAIDVSPDGREVWVGHNDDGRIVVLDATTLAKIAEVASGPLPIRVQFTPDGATVLVSCAASGELAFLDARTRRETGRVAFETLSPASPAPPGWKAGTPVPVGILVEPSGERAFVALAAAQRVAVVDLAKRTVVATFTTGNGPDGLGFARGG